MLGLVGGAPGGETPRVGVKPPSVIDSLGPAKGELSRARQGRTRAHATARELSKRDRPRAEQQEPIGRAAAATRSTHKGQPTK